MVKSAVRVDNLSYDITTRRTKSDNIILVIPGKDQADNLASALRTRLGDKIGNRRPATSVILLIIGIEDSVEDPELQAALANYDPELHESRKYSSEKSGIRSAVVRVPIRAGFKLVEVKKIKIGWSVCRISKLNDSALLCNKCKKKEHSVNSCNGVEKRRCFRCKEHGHLIAACPYPAGEPTPAIDDDNDKDIVTPSCRNVQDCEARSDPAS